MDIGTYIIKVNVAIAIFYVVYRCCRRDTFFAFRRFVLQGMILLSATYPFLDFSRLMSRSAAISEIATAYVNVIPQIALAEAVAEPTKRFGTADVLLLVYAAVAGVLLLRIVFGVLQIVRLRMSCEKIEVCDTKILRLTSEIAPFSFFDRIFANPDRHTESEMREILNHEKIHLRQHHSADVMIAEIMCALCWFNPFARMMRRSIKSNLEFLADSGAVGDGADTRSYQYYLLHLSGLPYKISIVNNFNVSLLKERIIMLNKKKSSKMRLATFALLLPFVMLLLVTNNASAIAARMSKVVETVAGESVLSAGEPIAISVDSTEISNLKSLIKELQNQNKELLGAIAELREQTKELLENQSRNLNSFSFSSDSLPDWTFSPDSLKKYWDLRPEISIESLKYFRDSCLIPELDELNFDDLKSQMDSLETFSGKLKFERDSILSGWDRLNDRWFKRKSGGGDSENK